MKYEFRTYEELTTDFTHDLSVYLTRDKVETIEMIKNAGRKGQYRFLQQTKDLLDQTDMEEDNKAQIFTGAVILIYFELIEEYKGLFSFLSDETESLLYLHALDILRVKQEDFVDPKSRVECVTALLNFFEKSICNGQNYVNGLNKESQYLHNETTSHKVFAIWNRAATVISNAYSQMLQQAQRVTEEKDREQRLTEEQERMAQEQERLTRERAATGSGSRWRFLNPFKSSASSSNHVDVSESNRVPEKNDQKQQQESNMTISLVPLNADSLSLEAVNGGQANAPETSSSVSSALATHGLLSASGTATHLGAASAEQSNQRATNT